MHADAMLAEARTVATVVLFAAALLICAVLGVRRWVGVVLLTLLSLVWLTVDKLWEGPRLLRLSAGHTIVAADLVGLAGLLVAAVLAVVQVVRATPRDTADR